MIKGIAHRIRIKLVLFPIMLLCCSSLSAQNDDDYEPNRDSVWGFEFDMSELDYRTVKMDQLVKKLSRIKQYNDSMMRVVKMKNIKLRSDSLMQLYDLLNGDVSTSYNAYSFFAGQYHSDVRALNSTLKIAGFPKFRDMGFHLTNFFDYTWKRKRIIQDLFISDGMAQEVSLGNIGISYKFRSPVNYSFGFCVIDNKRIQFFPFACLSWQTSLIRLTNTNEDLFEIGKNGIDTIIYHTINNTRGVEYEIKRHDLVLNYGAELDFHLFYSKRERGVIVGVRGAGAQSLLTTGWQFQGKRNSQLAKVNLKDYYFDLVVRIYFRREGKRGTYNLMNNWWEN